MDETIASHAENRLEQRLSVSSAVFKRFQWIFLIGRFLASIGDNLPASYRYALYDSYGISRSTIELLGAGSYGSSLFIGTFSSALADRYGRRLICFFSAGFYILNCILLNFSSIWLLAIGSIVWGVGNAFYHTGFEAWLIQEYRDRLLDLQSLKRILRNAFVGIALLSAGVAVFAQLLVQIGGLSAPFIAAMVFWILTIFFLWYFWPENYGSKETKAITTFVVAFRILRADPRIVLLGMASALFDTSFYIFVIEWTPTLQSAHVHNAEHPLPLGIIFAILEMFSLSGSFIFALLTQRLRPQSYMIVVFLLAAGGLMFPILAPNSLSLIFIGFIVFEICYGITQPSFYLLRNLYIPDEVRATIMSYMRVPQLIFMLVILLGHFSLPIVFILCASCNLLASLCMVALRGLKLPEEPAHVSEAIILLDEPSSQLERLH